MLQNLAKMRKNRWPENEEIGEARKTTTKKSSLSNGPAPSTNVSGNFGPPTVLVKMPNTNNENLRQISNHCSIGAEPNCSKGMMQVNGGSASKRKENAKIASGPMVQSFGGGECKFSMNANQQPELEISENEPQHSNTPNTKPNRISSNFEMNNSSGSTLAGFQQHSHSPATSPGASSTQSQRSFHFHLSTSTLANLRKSGVNLVKNIPGNIRRSSLAMFQMRAMGTVDSVKGCGGDMVDLPGTTSAGMDRRRNHRPSADSSTEMQSADTMSLHRQHLAQWAAKSSSSNSCSSTGGGVGSGAGTIAKRAMRKRISAAKTVLRKISRISTQSASGCSSISNVGTSSSVAGIARVASTSSGYCSPKRTMTATIPCCSCPNCSRAEMAATHAECSLVHSTECRKCSNRLLEVDWQRKMEDGQLKRHPEEPKKKRSWTATFVKNKKGKSGKSRKGPTLGGEEDGEAEAAAAAENAIARFGSGCGGKKPLGPSLSWDPQQQQWLLQQQRSRTSSAASQTSRSRIHSDGSAKQRFPLRDSNSGYWPSAFFSLNAQKCPSQTNSIGEQAEKEKGRHQFEKHSKKGASAAAGKRRKKSTSALALCKGGGGRGNGNKKSGATLSQSQSLSTLGGLEFGPDQEKALGRSALESSCLHCALLAEYRTTNLRAEIECAVKRLAARLSNGGSPARARRTIALGEQKLEKEKKTLAQQQREEAVEQRQMMEMLRRQMGTPDIVVSSCNSEDTPESADEGFWTNPSPSHPPTNNSHHHHQHQQQPPNSATIPVMPSPIALSPSSNPFDGQNDGLQDASSLISHLKAQSVPPMDTLKPPGFPFGLPCSSTSSSQSPSSLCSPLTAPFDSIGSGGLSSPPRSNSVDLSQLRRDIELWSVSSLSDVEGCSAQAGAEGRPGTAGISTPGGDSIRTVRSRSYDPSSSPEHMLRRPSRIEHLSEIFRKALAKSPVVKRAAAAQEHEHKRVPKHRTSRYWLEEQLTPSEHIWLPSSSTSSSSATTVDTECYLGEKDCEKLGEKRRCAACHIVAHTACFPLLAKMNLSCKYTFRDCASTSASSRRQNAVAKDGNGDSLQKHHWVHRWRLEGRCFHCGKSFQQKMFREKEVIAITCSWCKRSYHNKRSCFSLARFDDHCDRGLLREMILPPGWLLRLGHQRRHRHQQQAQQTAAQLLKKSKRKYRPFVVKQFDQPAQHHQQIQQNGPSSDSASHQLAQPNGRLSCCGPSIQPLLVFVNPKSGGNKGAKALNSLCWLLNPRQVFDINAMRGPKFGLEMFRKVASHMRILVCGGDGTVGWVLSTLDLLNWALYPPIALLPLGTGNDLSRSMGWGGTFSDEPLSEMLQAIQTETSVTHLDRWRLDVFPLPSTETSNSNGGQQTGNNETTSGAAGSAQEDQQPSTPTCLAGNAAADASSFQTTLPLSVMNNYFSIGADAHVALQFHHSRSANPQMLNSRLKNRIAYGGLGTIDLFKRTWKDLTEFITVECDGVDITPKLRELKFHCILFHNIAFYAGGTVPWGAGGDGVQESCGEVFSRPSPCDGKIEVLGFTTATLATLQMGGKGERIAQCSKVRIETSKPIPMQVDGEPTLLGPSLILLSFHNKVPMLRREKFARMSGSAPANNIISMNANRRKSSNNSSSGGGSQSVIVVGGNAAAATNPCSQISPMVTMPTPPQHQHKCSRASLCADSIVQRPMASSPPNSVFLCVPIVVVGRHDYDTYRDSVDRLKDTGFELGTINVEAEMELGQLRQQIQQMLTHHQILPYEPGRDWRYLDYVSNSEEGAFRISRQQEHCRTVADVCTLDDGAGILILDDAFPSMTVRSAAIGHELVFCPPGTGKPMSAIEQNLLMRRRISETLRIVLSSESQETHL